ncbi:hypothetical protein HN873_013019 [Arachis hypogaea]
MTNSGCNLLALMKLIFVHTLFALVLLTVMSANTMVAASNSSSLNEEQKALLHSGWTEGRDISKHCNWTELTGLELKGTIPSEISTLTKLMYLDLSSNYLEGELPTPISNLTQLKLVNVASNFLRGVIPSTFGQLKCLAQLSLHSNNLEGPIPIPERLGYLKHLEQLTLSNNSLNGSIPSTFGQLEDLESLSLDSNHIEGPIPVEFENLFHLKALDLSHNNISGVIPSGIGQLSRLSTLDISNNSLKGPIPFGILNHCSYVQLSNNFLSGHIPSQIGNLSYLDLSNNSLSGSIPEGLHSVPYLNISYNSFIPDTHFCGFPSEALIGNKQSPSCSSPYSTIALVSLAALNYFFITTVFIWLGISVFYPLQREYGFEERSKNGDIFSVWNYDGKIAFKDIIKATEDFDIRYCIGIGAYGSVYKAQLPSGRNVALRSFTIQSLKIYHFTRVLAMRSSCMFLVYEYMEKGNLFYNLAIDEEAQELNWKVCLSDFGTAKLLSSDSSNQTLLAGTPRYVAPETIMGEHPKELLSNMSKPSPPKIMIKDVLDSRIPLPFLRKDMQDIVLVLTLALACLHPNPKSRPSMQDIANELLFSKSPLLWHFDGISIHQLVNQEIYAIGKN